MTAVLLAAAVAALFPMLTLRIGIAVTAAIVSAVVALVFMPIVNASHPGWLLTSLLIGIALSALPRVAASDSRNEMQAGVAALGLAGLLVISAVGWVASTWMFNAKTYRGLVGEVERVEFTAAVEVVEPTQIRIVDQQIARRRAQEVLGADPSIGSRAVIGEMSVQSVGGRLKWVAPLEPAGLIRWLSNDGTPGYVVVDANNMSDARLVLEHGGRPIKLTVTESGFLGGNLHRHLWMGGFAHRGFTDHTFEIDDTGRPHYVTTLYSREVAWGAEKPVGVIVTDAQTGTSTEYSIAEAPAWVDRIVPAEMATDMLDAWGMLVRGAFNWAGLDVISTTPGIALVYGSDQRAYWYTGMSMPSNTSSTTGFVLMDSRTGKTRMFELSGATESVARDAMRGRISNFAGWDVSWPILYNVGGTPTYIATVKDGSGNYKGMAVAAVANRAVVVTGDDLRDALRQYQAALLNQGMAVAAGPAGRRTVFAGTVERFGSETIEGGTTHYAMIANHPGIIFALPPKLDPAVSLTRVGDTVSIEADETGEGVLTAVAFANAAVTVRRTGAQRAVEDAATKVEQGQRAVREERDAEARWKALSPEERQRILDALKR